MLPSSKADEFQPRPPSSAKADEFYGRPRNGGKTHFPDSNNNAGVYRIAGNSPGTMDGLMNSTMNPNNGGYAEMGPPGVISPKSSVLEDALAVQNRPFSAISSSDPDGGEGSRGSTGGNAGLLERTTTMLGVIGVVATAMSVLSVVLIIRFDYKQGETDDSLLKFNETTGWGGLLWYESLLDVGTVLSSFCVMLNLHCVVVCVSQCYFASKMMKLPHGNERSLKYLRNTSCLRYFAVSSFAVGVPIFILALCTYLLLEFRFVAASVSSGLLILGVLMIFCSFTHSIFLWKFEKNSASKLFKPKCNIYNVDGRFTFSNHVDLNFTDSNLSTMV